MMRQTANSISLLALRHLEYGDMRRYVDRNMPQLTVKTVAWLKDTDYCGLYVKSVQTIYISLGMTYTQKRCTLVHELVHWEHGDTDESCETRTRIETANILIDPQALRVESIMYGTDYMHIAGELEVTWMVLADWMRSHGVSL